MQLRIGLGALLVMCVALVAPGHATAASGAPAAKGPVYRVASGSVKGTDHATALRGTVTVRNAGTATAPATRLLVQLTQGSAYQVVARVKVPAVKAGQRHQVSVRTALPAWLPNGQHIVRVCYGPACKNVGSLTRSSRPLQPASYEADTPFEAGRGDNSYEIDVPSGYDSSHRTPTELFVWLHGCGGQSAGDIYNVAAPSGESYIAVAPLRRENGCWKPGDDVAVVEAVVADVRKHYNIDPRRLVLGGYSSGGDLSYRMAFYKSEHVAGILVCNTSPFRDTGSTAQASLKADSFKFRAVHLLHTEDDTYPAAGVRSEISKMTDAGFKVTTIERPGHHYDNPGAGVPGTDADIATYLLPHLDDGWKSPGR